MMAMNKTIEVNKQERIVITGMGAVSPLGTGVNRYWEELIAGGCGIRRIAAFDASELAVQIAGEVPDFRPEDHMPVKLIHDTDAFTQYAFAAAGEALRDAAEGARHSAGASQHSAGTSRGPSGEALRDAAENVRHSAGTLQHSTGTSRRPSGASARATGETVLPASPERCGIVMGTAMSGIDTIAATQEILTNATHKNVGPRFVPRILGNIAAAQIAIEYGMTGPSFTLSTACASGGDAVLMGAMQLLAGEADMMLAVGADSTLCPLVIYSLANARALSRDNDDPAGACRPFDAAARGFVMGEGGGALVLETESRARARGARIYAELAGWANNNDAYHVTKPVEDGLQEARCMRQALAKAGMLPEEIDHINAHGTGTKAGDLAEAAAMKAVFGTCSPAISATKAATGHMMGGGGITEAIACIQAIRTGVLPPTRNLADPIADLDFVTETRDGQDIRTAMTNAFGFGGQNSTLIFRRCEE